MADAYRTYQGCLKVDFSMASRLILACKKYDVGANYAALRCILVCSLVLREYRISGCPVRG
jgi:hypothetical protein